MTKLSLLLKVLEGESDETIDRNLQLFHERALPDLGGNIKCGNSLIGSDFFQGRLNPTDPEERYRINAFDWDREFQRIVQDGGFDVIVGNPPYRRELDYKHLLDDIASTEFGKRFRAPRMDLWYYFVHRGLGLLRRGGTFAFIVNAYWTAGTGARKLINALQEEAHLEEVFWLGTLPVFRGVSGQHMILRVGNERSPAPTLVKIAKSTKGATDAEPFVTGDGQVEAFEKSATQLFRNEKVDLLPPADELLARLEQFPPLNEAGIIRQGIAENPADINKKTNAKFNDRWTTGEGVFSLTPEELAKLNLDATEETLIRPYHDLKDLDRYWVAENPSRRLIYSTKNSWPGLNANPTLAAHLARFRPIMEKRRETQKGSNRWWHLHWPRDENIWHAPKIMALQMAWRPSFAPSFAAVYVPFSVNVFVPKESVPEHLYYFTAVLNSRVAWVWFQHHAKRRGVGLEINGNVLSRFPMRRIDFEDEADVGLHDALVNYVETLLTLNQGRRGAKTAHEGTLLDRRLMSLEAEIDTVVDALYGLSRDDVAAVELATLSSEELPGS